MAYSHLRLRRALALVRILTGLLFLILGAHKISSWEFARVEFPQFVWDATHGAAVGFYADFLGSLFESHPSGVAFLVGMTELFIGVGLFLGLAVRPISLLGMIYTVNLMLATCMAPGLNEGLWRYLDNEARLIMLFFLFLLFGIGHAGENWGLGSLYHRHRNRQWEEESAPKDEPARRPNGESYSERYKGELQKDELTEESRQHWEPDEAPNVRRMKL